MKIYLAMEIYYVDTNILSAHLKRADAEKAVQTKEDAVFDNEEDKKKNASHYRLEVWEQEVT